MLKFILAFTLFVSSFSSAQIIDSSIVFIERGKSDTHGWRLENAYVDSFSQGKLIDSIRFDGNWNKIYQLNYQYDSNGMLLQRTYLPDNSIYNNRRIFTYDSLLRVASEIYQVGAFFNNNSQWTFTYNAAGQLSGKTEAAFDGSGWIDVARYDFNYDANDSLVYSEKKLWKYGLWLTSEKHDLTYSTSLKTDTLQFLDSLTGGYKYKSLTIFYRDNLADTCILNLLFNQTTQSWDSLSKYSYVFNSNNRLVRWESYFYNGGWFWGDGDAISYDSLGRIKSVHNLNPDLCTDDEDYYYDGNGNLIMQVYFQNCPNSSYEHEKRIYYTGQNVIMIPDQMEICSDDSVQIGPVLNSYSGSYTFQWIPSTGLSNDTILDPYVFVDTTTTYTLIIIDSTGVVDSLTLNVTVKPSASLDIIVNSIDSIYPCYSIELALDPLPNADCEWFLDGLPLYETHPYISNQQNGTYSVRVEFFNGCTTTDSISISNMPQDTLPVVMTDICNGYVFTSYPQAKQYKWMCDNPSGLFFTTLDTLLPASGDKYYSVIVKDSNNCLHYSAPVFMPLKSYYYSVIPAGCGGLCNGGVNFVNMTLDYAPYSFYWPNGDSTTCNPCSTVTYTDLCAGANTIMMEDSEGCVRNIQLNIPGNSNPFTMTTQLTPDPGQSCSGAVTIWTSSGNPSGNVYLCVNDSCEWFHSDTTLSNLCWGTYNIALYNNGCVLTDTITIDSIAVSVSEGEQDFQYSIHPNPFSDIAVLSSGNDAEYFFELFDLTGRLIRSSEKSIGNTIIDGSDLQEGIYLVNVQQDGSPTWRKKIVVFRR